MTDLYTKIVLTIIAVALSVNVFQGLNIGTPAWASSNQVHKIAICEADGRQCTGVTGGGFLRVLN